MDTYGLGRRPAPDERDRGYLLAKPTITRTARFWWGYRTRLDQGQTPQCVAYSWSHFIIDSPTPHKAPLIAPAQLYHEAQLIDEWPGEDYEGTSVRAGAKVLVNHAEIQTEYRWAFDLDTLVANVLEVGPVIVGTNWYDSQFEVDKQFYARITPGAEIAGGHAYKIDGVNVPKRFVRCKNSWGIQWGHAGFFRLSFDDLERLLSEDGEACMAVEVGA